MLFTATTIATVMQSCTQELQRQPKFVLFVVYVVIVPLCIMIPSVRIYRNPVDNHNDQKRQQQNQQPCECFQGDRPIATANCNQSSNHCRSNLTPTVPCRNVLISLGHWSISSISNKPIPTNHTNFFVRLDIVNVLLILIALLSNPTGKETGSVISFYSLDAGIVLVNTKHFYKLCVIFISQIVWYLFFTFLSLVFVSCKHVLPRRIINIIYSKIHTHQFNFCLHS